MIDIRQLKRATLVRLGFGALALRGVFQMIVDHTIHSNDATDFASGALMGIGFAILAIYAWKYGRFGRGKPDAPCAS